MCFKMCVEDGRTPVQRAIRLPELPALRFNNNAGDDRRGQRSVVKITFKGKKKKGEKCRLLLPTSSPPSPRTGKISLPTRGGR